MPEVVVFRLEFFRHLKGGQHHLGIEFIGIYLVDHLIDVLDGFRDIRKERFHLFLGLEIEFIVWKAIPVTAPPSHGRGFHFVLFYAEQYIMGFRVVFTEVKNIVGSDNLDIILGSEFQ